MASLESDEDCGATRTEYPGGYDDRTVPRHAEPEHPDVPGYEEQAWEPCQWDATHVWPAVRSFGIVARRAFHSATQAHEDR